MFGIKRRILHLLPVQLRKGSGLHRFGWAQSAKTHSAIDAQGKPLPWYTYPAISLLDRRLPPGVTVFEFGCGNSSLWWSLRASYVHAVEHEAQWAEATRKRAPKHLVIDHVGLEEDSEVYQKSCAATGRSYQIIVIDGRRRVKCIKSAITALATDGVVVWDNSDRDDYAEGYAFLLANGFRRVDFWGMGPINDYEWCTSIFYREGNLLCL